MSTLPWYSALLFLASGLGLLSVIAVWTPAHFHPEKREMRAIKRKRRKRRKALNFLRSTAERDHYNEFTRVQ